MHRANLLSMMTPSYILLITLTLQLHEFILVLLKEQIFKAASVISKQLLF